MQLGLCIYTGTGTERITLSPWERAG